MSCSSCGTKTEGQTPTGCGSNGTCGTDGCNALNVYDWFKDMDFPEDFEQFNIVEVRFKGSRKEYYKNSNKLELYTGDYVITEGAFGFDLGTVSASGEIVRLQLKKYRIREDSEQVRTLMRKANDKEIEKFDELKAKENSTLERARTIAFSLKLAMKLSDIEFQGDGRKVTFFYTAESRVDFRELIRRYADEFRVKIEMRHISYREEASRLGGIGDCGRQLCCSTWLTDYKMVTTGAARVQNLSINMEKLAGQCGRLKCCLNYELDTYVEALNEFPKAKVVKLDTVGGFAFSKKIDILKRLMWFAYEGNPNWLPLTLEKVNEIMQLNKDGKQGPNLSEIAVVQQLASHNSSFQEAEVINNEELLQEDKEFEEALRKKREQKERSGSDLNRNNNRNNRNRPSNRPEHKGENRNENRGPNSQNKDKGPANRPPGGQNRNRKPDNRNNKGGGNNRPNNGPPLPPKE